MWWLVLSLLLATSVSAGERVPATFEVRTGDSSKASHAPDGFVLVVRYQGLSGKEIARGFPFQLDRMNSEFSHQEEIRDCRQNLVGKARMWIEDLFQREEYDWDSLDLLVAVAPPQEKAVYSWGAPDDESGFPRMRGRHDSQLKILFPTEDGAGDSFRIRYLETHDVDAPGYCYDDGESAGSDRPKGSFVDPDVWGIRGGTKSYRIYLDGEREPILRAVDFTGPEHDLQRFGMVPDASGRAR